MTVRREVAKSAGLSVVAVLLISAGCFWAARTAATAEALRQAEESTSLIASTVVGPSLTAELLRGDQAAIEVLDETVQRFVISDRILTVKVWSPDGKVLYTDDLTGIGTVFPLAEDQREVLATGQPHASLSDLAKAENADQGDFSELLEVYVPVTSTEGKPLLFETYQSTEGVDSVTQRLLTTFVPVVLAGLLLYAGVQLLLSWLLARKLGRAQKEREALLQHALDASEHERASIAADLHDGVVQDLVGLTFALDGLAADARGGAATELTNAAGTTRRSVRSLRSLLVEIYPANLAEVGLAGAVDDLAAAATAAGITVLVRIDPDAVLDDQALAAAYRTVREALSNVKRHAHAAEVAVELVAAPSGGWVLTVADDGDGFDPSHVPSGHVGLRLLHDLAASVGGSLVVTSSPGRGTTVRLELPA
jgi:signal transduction histidine kinase